MQQYSRTLAASALWLALSSKRMAEDPSVAGLSLGRLLAKRWEREKEPDPYRKRQKVFHYFLGRGFPSEAIDKALRALEL